MTDHHLPPTHTFPGPAPAAARPEPLTWAVRLMWIAFAWHVLSTGLSLLSLAAFVYGTTAGRGSSLLFLGQILLQAVIIAALWVVMALANARGRAWARVVATVLGVLSIGVLVVNLVQFLTVWTIAQVAGVVLNIVIVVLLWAPANAAYYRRT